MSQLCEYGCGKLATVKFKRGKHSCCENFQECPGYQSSRKAKKEERNKDVVHNCEYGCGNRAIKKFRQGKWCCSENYRDCPGYKKTRAELCYLQRGLKKNVSYKPCQYCGTEVATNNLKKHENWCSGNGKDKRECVVCGSVFYKRYCKTCSDKCFRSYQSSKLKEEYASGRKKPFGGNGCRRKVKLLDGDEIQVMSSYEADACVIFDSWLVAGKIKYWEYTNDRFSYLDETGTERTYFPDFKIINLDGSFYYLETKGFEKVRDSFKWNSLRDRGISLEVWFKDDIVKHMDDKD